MITWVMHDDNFSHVIAFKLLVTCWFSLIVIILLWLWIQYAAIVHGRNMHIATPSFSLWPKVSSPLISSYHVQDRWPEQSKVSPTHSSWKWLNNLSSFMLRLFKSFQNRSVPMHLLAKTWHNPGKSVYVKSSIQKAESDVVVRYNYLVASRIKSNLSQWNREKSRAKSNQL